MKRSVPWESAIFISSYPIDTAPQLQKMRIKNFLICHDKIYLSSATFGVELDI